MRWSRAGLRFFVLSYFVLFFVLSANYSVHPTHPLGGPRSRKHCCGRDDPIQRWSRTPGSQRGGGSVCKTKHCWGLGGAGSASPSKSGPEPHSIYYYSAVQYSWSIHPPRDQEPGPTRVVGRPKGSCMGVFFT